AGDVAVRSASPVAPDPDLGSRERALRARADHPRNWHESVLRRPPLALAAPDEREHKRVVAAVLPERNRPVSVVGRGTRSSCSRAQQPAPESSRLAYARGSICRAATIISTDRCCIDRLNSPFIPPRRLAHAAASWALLSLWALLAQA